MDWKQIRAIILDHNLFIATVIGIFVLAVGLLIYGQFFVKDPKVQEIVVYQIEKKPVQFPLELNVSDDFTKEQVGVLSESCRLWETATHGQAKFKIISDWQPPEAFTESAYLTYPKNTVWKKSSTNPNVVGLALKHGFADGIQKGNFLIVLDDYNNIENSKLKVVFAHELGHMMGFEHLKPQYPGLMDIGGNDGQITKYDMIQFCHLYNCDSNSMLLSKPD